MNKMSKHIWNEVDLVFCSLNKKISCYWLFGHYQFTPCIETNFCLLLWQVTLMVEFEFFGLSDCRWKLLFYLIFRNSSDRSRFTILKLSVDSKDLSNWSRLAASRLAICHLILGAYLIEVGWPLQDRQYAIWVHKAHFCPKNLQNTNSSIFRIKTYELSNHFLLSS